MLRVLMICAALGIAGCAATHAPQAKAQQARTAGSAPPCVQSASRIPRNDCSAAGRAYTQEDLERTGQVDVGSALQMLDPSISSTVHH